MTEGRPVTIHDVARLAGVAVSSVSRVLSDHPDVSSTMRIKVRNASDALGYSPDPMAQSLRSGSTRTIGFVVRDFANPFFGQIIHGVEEELTSRGYTLLVTNGGGDPAREAAQISVLRQRRVDALLLSSISETARGSRKSVTAFDRPVVLLDRDMSKLKIGNIQFDHATGVHRATTDLLGLGHRRIAMITGNADIRPTRERLRGYQEAHSASGVPAPKGLQLSGSFSETFARSSTTDLLALPKSRRPTAIVAGGVQTTIGVLEALSELGLRAGEDLSLVVCDDLPWLKVMRPTISVVGRDAESMGKAAAEMALGLINGAEPTTVILPTTYERRDSSCQAKHPAASSRVG